MAAMNQYSIIGRHMDGRGVTGYQVAVEGKGSRKLTREQVCFLVGRRQIANCEGQVYADKVILRGVGVNLDELPIIADKTGTVTNTANVGAIRKGTDAVSAVNQLMLVGQLVSGRNTVGYIVANSGGVKKKLSRDDVLKFAKAGRLGNARTQEYNGRTILRGVGVNLNELPVTNVGQPKSADTNVATAAPAAPVTPARPVANTRPVTQTRPITQLGHSGPRSIPLTLAGRERHSSEECLEAINARAHNFSFAGERGKGESTDLEVAEDISNFFDEIYSLTHISCSTIAGCLHDGLIYFNNEGIVTADLVHSEVIDEMIKSRFIRITPESEQKIYDFIRTYYNSAEDFAIMRVLERIHIDDDRVARDLAAMVQDSYNAVDFPKFVSNKLCKSLACFLAELALGSKGNLLSQEVHTLAAQIFTDFIE